MTAAALSLAATSADAQDADKHQLCAERPGLTTNECTIEQGHAQIETSFADWTLEKRNGERTGTLLAGDALLRVGIAEETEVRLGWTAFGHVRDRQSGMTDTTDGVGDVTIGLKHTLIDAQKHGNIGFSLALIPFAMLPVGRPPIGDGTWSAGAQVPIGDRLSKTFKLELTPEIEAAADDDGRGRHLRYSAAFGAKYDLTDTVNVTAEVKGLRDDDPDRDVRGTQALGALSLAVQPDDRSQIDLGTVVGLNRAAPDIEVSIGAVRWF